MSAVLLGLVIVLVRHSQLSSVPPLGTRSLHFGLGDLRGVSAGDRRRLSPRVHLFTSLVYVMVSEVSVAP
jgi:hypothetical protein